MEVLSQEELLRYERSLRVDNFGAPQQLLLRSASVLVVGAGGLGCAVLPYLIASGIGCCGIVDYDTVSLSNLQRQVLYRENDLGHPKAMQAFEQLKGLNTGVDIVVHNIKIDVDNVSELIGRYDVIVDCSDNYTVRYIVDKACFDQGKPMVYGSVEGMRGQLSTFHHAGAKGYNDLYPCRRDEAKNIGVLSPVPGVIGSMQALEVLKVITNTGETLAGRLLTVDLSTNRFCIFDL